MSTHRFLSGLELHDPYHYVQEDDPGAVGANLYWLKVSTGTVRRRNAFNSAWDVISAGTTTFTGLTDAPSSYTGQAGKSLRVNSLETALEFFSSGGGGSSGYVDPPPTASNDPGDPGQYASDGTKLYFCYATNSWKYVNLIGFGGLYTLTYSTDGDANGILHKFGELNGNGTWVNPLTTGGSIAAITCTASTSTETGNFNALFDRATNDWYVNTSANPWFKIDFGAGRGVKPNKFSFRQRSGGIYNSSMGMTMEGSNDNSSYTNLLTWSAGDPPQGSNEWKTVNISASTIYRYIRFSQVGTSYFTCGEIEFYGDALIF